MMRSLGALIAKPLFNSGVKNLKNEDTLSIAYACTYCTGYSM